MHWDYEGTDEAKNLDKVPEFDELADWQDKVYSLKIGISSVGLSCIGDQILVLEDKFRTGYECSKCDGEGYLDEKCPSCSGTGKEAAGTDRETICRTCCPRNLVESGKYTPGKLVCSVCEGKGSLIVAPQISERKPSSGTIVSVGPEVYPDCRIINKITGQRFVYPMKMGDRVLYTQFAGTSIDIKQKGLIRIMHCHEVLCKLYGKAKIGDFTR